ncbi:hypothetical protein KFK09_007756 [Dendrobium nobile]|uniref:Uncharacterized protein n=1 Tax=Dendrobium nobile TaxID=94219 RepID=A0A8T3BY11_DENNO|nr:hypothetical protein KFK09_007756 [Dendrobium nobile]
MEGRFGNLEEMMKRMLQFQTKAAPPEIKGNQENDMSKEDGEVKILGEEEGIPHLDPLPRREVDREFGDRREWEEDNMRVEFEGREGYERRMEEREPWRDRNAHFMGGTSGRRGNWGGGDLKVRKLKMPVLEGKNVHG